MHIEIQGFERPVSRKPTLLGTDMICFVRPRDFNAVCHIHSLYCYEHGLLLEIQRFEHRVF
jgi:hypothetical protein